MAVSMAGFAFQALALGYGSLILVQTLCVLSLIFALPFVTLGTAILMVSQIPYPHVLNLYLRGKQPFSYLIRVLLFLWLAWWSMQTALVLISVTFVGSGLVKWLYAKASHEGGRLFSTGPKLVAHPSGESDA